MVKKNQIIFTALYFLLYELKKCVLRFFKSLDIFIVCGVFFSRCVQLENSFFDEKDISGEG